MRRITNHDLVIRYKRISNSKIKICSKCHFYVSTFDFRKEIFKYIKICLFHAYFMPAKLLFSVTG